MYFPFQMLLAAHQRNPLGVTSHRRWTRVSTPDVSSCSSSSPRRHKAPRPKPELWENEVSANDRDAELCNDESDKYPEVGAAGRRRGGPASAGVHGDGETRGWVNTKRPRREPCAPAAAGPSCSALTLLLSEHTASPALHPLEEAVQRCWCSALIAPRISVPARPLSSNARGLERKLGLADRKSWIRFFPLSGLM